MKRNKKLVFVLCKGKGDGTGSYTHDVTILEFSPCNYKSVKYPISGCQVRLMSSKVLFRVFLEVVIGESS